LPVCLLTPIPFHSATLALPPSPLPALKMEIVSAADVSEALRSSSLPDMSGTVVDKCKRHSLTHSLIHPLPHFLASLSVCVCV
jgi:hypothetical protein